VTILKKLLTGRLTRALRHRYDSLSGAKAKEKTEFAGGKIFEKIVEPFARGCVQAHGDFSGRITA
jgi:hypothetical protein